MPATTGTGFDASSAPGTGFVTGAIDERTPVDSADFRHAVPRFTADAR